MKKVKGKYIRLTESQLKQIINESVTNILLEYACERGEFLNIVNHEAIRIIQNWCLVRFCTLTGREQTKNHWQNETVTHMANIGKNILKKNKKFDAKLKAILQGFEGYFQPSSIYTNLRAKIEKEDDIDINSPAMQQAIQDCAEQQENIAFHTANYYNENIRDYVNTI